MIVNNPPISPIRLLDEPTYVFIQVSLETYFYKRKEELEIQIRQAENELAQRVNSRQFMKPPSSEGDIIEQALSFLISDNKRTLGEITDRFQNGTAWVKNNYRPAASRGPVFDVTGREIHPIDNPLDR